MSRRTLASLLRTVVVATVFAGCAGQGCDCLAELEAEFPLQAKQRAGVQVRLTASGLDFLSENAFDLLSEQIGETLVFDVPADCSSDPTVCCGYPEGYCQMELDLRDYGEGSHFEVEALNQAGNRLGITIWPRVRTLRPMPARSFGPLGGAIDCNVEFNTRFSGTRWMSLYFEIVLGENSDTGELGVTVTTAEVGGISTADINIFGDFLCRFGSEQDAVNGIAAGFRRKIPEAIEGFLCATCESDGDCGAGASCENEVCAIDGSNECRQSFAIAGRHQAGSVLGSLLSSALEKQLDVYFAAGDQAISEASGLSLAVSSGMEPVATPDDHGCVPTREAPVTSLMPLASELRGNTNPNTSATYDFGAAIHVDALNRGAWAAHQSGYICLNLGTKRVDTLTTDAMLLVAPSLGNILGDRDRQPMYVLVRPQNPPSISLGEGTFVEGAGGGMEIDDALVAIELIDLELDFYALIDGRYARLFTVVADADIGISLDVDADGRVVPILDDPANALSNIRAKNVVILEETEAQIADRVPGILSVALGGLSSELGNAIALPDVAGLGVALSSGAFASTEDKTRLAIYANLKPVGPATREAVNTVIEKAVLGRDSVARVAMSLEAGMEWQFRIGDGFWSPFSTSESVSIRRTSLGVGDVVRLEVRSRRIGDPASLDRSPVVMLLQRETSEGDVLEPVPFHGEGDGGGCGECSSGGAPGLGGGLLVLFTLLIAFGRRRIAVGVVLLVSGAMLSSCSCGSDGIDGESNPDDSRQVQPGPVGRWVSADADDSRVVVAAYERQRGDLVVSTVREEGEPRYVAIDGVPTGPVSKDADGYRGGVEAGGADVGSWVSLRLREGEVVVAYVDNDRRSLRIAHEASDGYEFFDVDVPVGGESIGAHASLSLGQDGELGVAYMMSEVVAGEDDSKVVRSELRFATAREPVGPWTVETVASAEAPHESRIDMVPGTGLWASLAYRPSGPSIAFYDSVAGDLMLSSRVDGAWVTVAIDSDGDRGQHASLVANDETLYVAYQDADADRLLLREIAENGEPSDSRVIDSGHREGDRNHPVGANARLLIRGDEMIAAYQDAASSTLVIAKSPLGGDVWTHRGEISGGFGVGICLSGGNLWAATGTYTAGRAELAAALF